VAVQESTLARQSSAVSRYLLAVDGSRLARDVGGAHEPGYLGSDRGCAFRSSLGWMSLCPWRLR
jgi:hypothetical protein